MRLQNRGSASSEQLLLLSVVAVVGAAGFVPLGAAMDTVIARDAYSTPKHSVDASAPPTVAPTAQAGLASFLHRFGDVLIQAGEAARSRSGLGAVYVPLEGSASFGTVAEAAKPGVTALRNSTERVAQLESTLHASELPAKPEGAYRFVSFNSATGSHDVTFRAPENRTRLGKLLAQTDADVIGLQEVDFGNPRSGGVNTALDSIREVDPSFTRFGDGHRGPGLTVQEDGARLYRTETGTLVSGRSTLVRECKTGRACLALVYSRLKNLFASAKDGEVPQSFRVRPVSADYGTATYLGRRYTVLDAYVDVLNSALDEDWPRAYRDAEELGDVGRNRLNIRRREAYPRYQTKDAKRHWKRAEARAVLVTVARAENGEVHAIVNTHLALEDGVRAANIDHVARVAETQIAKGRRVFVLGDFNETNPALAERFEAAGLHRAAGSDIDIVWTSDDPSRVVHAADMHTDGTSDHAVAAVATVK